MLQAEPGSTSKVQLGLFSPQMPEPARLDVTLARIRAIVGEQNVGCAVLRDTHEPDGFRMEPFCLPSGQPSASEARRVASGHAEAAPAGAIFVRIMQANPTAAFVFRERVTPWSRLMVPG
jgi:protein ImuB